MAPTYSLAVVLGALGSLPSLSQFCKVGTVFLASQRQRMIYEMTCPRAYS